MDYQAKLALVVGIFSLTFMLNLPFGFMRRGARRFSLRWFLCIHLPIPIIFLGRMLSNLDMRYVPFFVFAAVLGQVWGGKLEL